MVDLSLTFNEAVVARMALKKVSNSKASAADKATAKAVVERLEETTKVAYRAQAEELFNG